MMDRGSSPALKRVEKALNAFADGTRSRDAEIKALRAPIPDRCACDRCGRRDGLDAVLRDKHWNRISEAAGGVNILCLWCMDEIAAALGIKAEVALHFAGRALHATTNRRPR